MYTIQDILRGIKNPRAAAREVNRLCHTRGGKFRYNPAGTGIFELDWDNLIILDACRYDIFRQLGDLPGYTDYRYSLASATYDFIPANFAGRSLLDTVYVGANIWFLKLRDEINSEVFKFINLQRDHPNIEWANKELNTATPETVTTHALDTASTYPHKRLIVHYLQPHHPFIGPNSRDMFEQTSSSLIDVMKSSNASKRDLREAYRENLELVLEEVDQLLSSLQGRTVVTADHGEMLGEKHDYLPIRDWGHHAGIFNDPSVKVPYHIYNRGERREIYPDSPQQDREYTRTEIDERLRSLGYKT